MHLFCDDKGFAFVMFDIPSRSPCVCDGGCTLCSPCPSRDKDQGGNGDIDWIQSAFELNHNRSWSGGSRMSKNNTILHSQSCLNSNVTGALIDIFRVLGSSTIVLVN